MTPSESLTTPVVLIVFRRPDTTRKVFDVIRRVRPSQLLVIADGPRAGDAAEARKCAETRRIVGGVDWDCRVLTNYSDVNLGCKERVSSGLDWVFGLVEEAIILEDDCIPDPSFFWFCQELLERYRDDGRVMQIAGENTHGYGSEGSSYYFSQYSFYWGWATWRRAWRLFDKRMESWPQLREGGWLERLLGSRERASYWAEIFELTYNGFNSWGWAWTFACFVHRGLCAVPNRNLISNVGFGADAAHTTWEVDDIAHLPTRALDFPLEHPAAVAVDVGAEDAIDKMRFGGRKYLRGLRQRAADLLNNGRYEEGLRVLERCIAFRPDLIDLQYEKGLYLDKSGDREGAIVYLNHLLRSHPHHEKSQLLLDEIYQKINPFPDQSPPAPPFLRGAGGGSHQERGRTFPSQLPSSSPLLKGILPGENPPNPDHKSTSGSPLLKPNPDPKSTSSSPLLKPNPDPKSTSGSPLLKPNPDHKSTSSSPLLKGGGGGIASRFLIYTMGKVGSTSISTSLKKYADQVYDIHFLDEIYLSKNMHKGHCVDSRFVLKNWLGKPLKIISMVRNPIEVNIGGFFQDIESYYPNLGREKIRQLRIEELIQKFLSFSPNYPLTWFEREFNKTLQFDVYSEPFSMLGWKTYLHGPYHILIMQAELGDAEKEAAIRQFTGITGFRLENYNISSQKWYGERLREFKEMIVVPQDDLKGMLNSRLIRHFYTSSQIEGFYRRWDGSNSSSVKL